LVERGKAGKPHEAVTLTVTKSETVSNPTAVPEPFPVYIGGGNIPSFSHADVM
jgi:hypothetical protein